MSFRRPQSILVGAILLATAPLLAQSGRVRIHVMDTASRAIPNAEASLFGNDGGSIPVGRANEDGEIVLAGIPAGDAKIRVTYNGFRPLLLTVHIPNTTELKLDARLEVGVWANTSDIKKHKRWWSFGSSNSN